jgi:hypothetical protein
MNFSKFNKLNLSVNNIFTLNETLGNHLNTLKTKKFLYNYSLLHKTILKDAHKLTMVKKLFSLGFFDTKIIEKNL